MKKTNSSVLAETIIHIVLMPFLLFGAFFQIVRMTISTLNNLWYMVFSFVWGKVCEFVGGDVYRNLRN